MSFFGELIDSFTGAGAKKAIETGINKQVDAVTSGRDQAATATRAAGAEARGYVLPYAQNGSKAYGLYSDTLGVNGADARRSAQDLYNSDDMLARNRAYDLSRSGRTMNASGSFNSGAAALADSRIRQQGYGDWQNRLGMAGQQGLGAATTAAGIATNEGGQISGLYSGTGQNLANVYGQGYGALAQANNTFAQNLIGLGSVGAKFWNPLGVNNIGGGGNAQGGRP